MKLTVYQDIVDYIRSLDSKGTASLTQVSKVFPQFSIKTLGSIYSQDYQRKTKKTHHKHYVPEKMEQYYNRYLSEIKCGSKDVLLKLAEDVDMAPSLLARIIIERHLAYTEFDEETPPKHVISHCLKDPSVIQDPVLAEEVNMCILTDQVYGPVVDVIKHSVGQEYECLLKHKLEKQGLAYLGEDQLRSKGYDKTPDVKLEIPIAVNGHVVNWIESKASFGDEESHKNYLKEQFWSYWNRFGPGLVIYWFGFIDELDIHQEKGILLMDHFPEEISTMSPLALLPRTLIQNSVSAVQLGTGMVQNSFGSVQIETQQLQNSSRAVQFGEQILQNSTGAGKSISRSETLMQDDRLRLVGDTSDVF